jgi:cyanophycinase
VVGRSGHLLMMGGGDGQFGTSSAIGTFVKLAGASGDPNIVLVTTATRYPDTAYTKYADLFRRYGVPHLTALGPITLAEADDPNVLSVLRWATAVLFTGGDQARIGALVGSRTNDVLKVRFACDGLVVAGTSAGATAMGCTMIIGGGYSGTPERVHTGPGLALLPDVLVDMHFTERARFQRLLSAVALERTRLGVGIDEDTAVLVKGDRFEVLGTGAVTVFDASAASVTCRPMEWDRPSVTDVRLHSLRPGSQFDLSRRTVIAAP